MTEESTLDGRWLSVEEISEYLGVKPDTIDFLRNFSLIDMLPVVNSSDQVKT